jgi:hypothetical protein
VRPEGPLGGLAGVGPPSPCAWGRGCSPWRERLRRPPLPLLSRVVFDRGKRLLTLPVVLDRGKPVSVPSQRSGSDPSWWWWLFLVMVVFGMDDVSAPVLGAACVPRVAATECVPPLDARAELRRQGYAEWGEVWWACGLRCTVSSVFAFCAATRILSVNPWASGPVVGVDVWSLLTSSLVAGLGKAIGRRVQSLLLDVTKWMCRSATLFSLGTCDAWGVGAGVIRRVVCRPGAAGGGALLLLLAVVALLGPLCG